MKYVACTLEYEINSVKAMGFKTSDSTFIIWLPHSQIRNYLAILDAEPRYREKVEVEIPEWLAVRKGLDPYCEELEDEVH